MCPKPSDGQFAALETQCCGMVVIVSWARDQRLVRGFERADRAYRWYDTAGAVSLGAVYEESKVRKGLGGSSWSETSEPCL